MVHILADGIKSMPSPFIFQHIGINELNPKFYWILCFFGGLHPEKPPVIIAEVHILKEPLISKGATR